MPDSLLPEDEIARLRAENGRLADERDVATQECARLREEWKLEGIEWLRTRDIDRLQDADERAKRAEAQRDRLLDAADKAVSGDLRPLAIAVREIRSGVRWIAPCDEPGDK